jgi:phosphatidylglycerophosphate synthase
VEEEMARGKTSVTDELLDAYVNRPLAAYVVRAVVATPVTPNQLTAVSMLFGVCGAVLIAMGTPFSPIAGGVCLFLSMVFDCSDGQLARARGGGSVSGRILDGYADYVVAVALHVSLLYALAHSGVTLFGHPFGTFERFLVVLFAGASMAINAGRFDFYKQRYLAHTDPSREPERPELFTDEAARAKSWLEKAALLLFAWYVRTQQGAAFDEAARLAKETSSEPSRRAQFADENGPLVRLWSFSGPTMHNGVLSAAAMMAPFVPQAFTWYCLFAIVPVNVYCVVLRILQYRLLSRERDRESERDAVAAE